MRSRNPTTIRRPIAFLRKSVRLMFVRVSRSLSRKQASALRTFRPLYHLHYLRGKVKFLTGGRVRESAEADRSGVIPEPTVTCIEHEVWMREEKRRTLQPAVSRRLFRTRSLCDMFHADLFFCRNCRTFVQTNSMFRSRDRRKNVSKCCNCSGGESRRRCRKGE